MNQHTRRLFMRTLVILFVLVALGAPVAVAQESRTNLLAEIAALDARIAQARVEKRSDAEKAALTESARAAAVAYGEAVESIPEIQSLDAQIEAARKQVSDLCRRRAAVLKANDAALAAVRKTREDAIAAHRRAIVAERAEQALIRKQNELRGRLALMDAQE